MSGHRRSIRDSVPIALIRARESVMARFRPLLAERGYTEQQWRVMRVLDEFGPMEPSVLAKDAALLMPSLTRILATLEKDGVIRRETHSTDKRKTVISLGPKGLSDLDAASAESNVAYSELEREFGAKNLEQLVDLLNLLADKHPKIK